jgi:hypothetical protein
MTARRPASRTRSVQTRGTAPGLGAFTTSTDVTLTAVPASRPKCDGCGHAFHRDECSRKGPSGCEPVLDPATGKAVGFACSRTRAPCPCPFGECHTCGTAIAGASPFPLGTGPEVDVDRGSAGAPDGQLAVRKLADGSLAVRRLADGEQPGEGEWRGREHEHAEVTR